LNKSFAEKDLTDAGNHYVAVRGMQEPQLHNDEEQKEALGTAGDQEVLQHLPQADGAQRGQVKRLSGGADR
jgi:hypothetical protein